LINFKFGFVVIKTCSKSTRAMIINSTCHCDRRRRRDSFSNSFSNDRSGYAASKIQQRKTAEVNYLGRPT